MNKLSWVDVISIVLAIIGLGSSYYFYELSVRERVPVLIEEPYRPLVVEAAAINSSPISIVKTNGKVLMKDISSLKFYLFNRGSESIKKQHVLKPLRVELASPDVEILEIKILSVSRPDVVLPMISLIKGSKNVASIDFNILEKNDGFAVQVLFAGAHASPLRIHGVIEGVEKILSNEDIESIQTLKTNMLALAIILFPILFFVALGFFFPNIVAGKRFVRITRSPNSPPPIVRWIISAPFLIVVLFALYWGYNSFQELSRISANKSVISSVPDRLRD